MNLKLQSPKQSLNKAYLKEKISRADIELFKVHFGSLLEKINAKGDEEHLKSLIADFLKLTYYNQSQHQINPIGKNDLVIHTGKSPNDPYGVILEVKSPGNKPEMITAGKTNAKAFHELVLYYLDERITRNRNELKQLVITNIYDWFIIDANEFDKKIYRNTAIKKLYELKKTDGKDNPWFYDELKKLIGNNPDWNIEATFFDIRDYKEAITNTDRQDDKGLIALYKILSPVHLLKVPFANDSNTLQPKFYSELLHLIGLYEYKEGSKKLISRKKEGERNAGSLLENAIIQLDSHDKISRLDKPSQYGETYQDRLYNVALELAITWVNRILFLKLLEAQLINYHKGDRSYTFLNKEKIRDFDDLDKLFFRVLAKVPAERTDDIQKLFGKVPYLNSSLFEPTELEHQTLFINGLEDFVGLPVLNSTVLKDNSSKVLKGKLDTLDYLFAFLNAYDFSSEGAEEIQEDNKTLINASVLGLIFEKINGYKDGSFFTPGFITMYMCRETIRRAVVHKFNEVKVWKCTTYDELYDKITDKKEANNIINSLKVCDPAVGSGHFLVSSLNEILAIKSDLKILIDKEGRTLRDYNVTVENDELIVTDADGDIFEYSPQSKESQRIQETLFHEKQTIIENCLFGVDINPNSVKICRLRLWIELLKNAYYKAGGNELETLPNIDINIKVGNSLISRFGLDADLKQTLRGTNWNINDYKIAVGAYKNATNKTEKYELVRLIDSIKTNFRSSISRNSKEYRDLGKFEVEYNTKYNTTQLFDNKLSKKQRLDKQDLERRIDKLKTLIEEIKTNKIYENAFEWRFEFPEVLDDDGGFIGFDIIVGNPPYMIVFNSTLKNAYEHSFVEFKRNNDLFVAFSRLAFNLLEEECYYSFITPNSFIKGNYFESIRKFFSTKVQLLEIIDFGNVQVFADANVFCAITLAKKTESKYDWNLKSGLNLNKGVIKSNSSDFTLKNEIISKLHILPKFEQYFLVKDVGFNYWSEGRGKVRGGSIGSRVFYNGIKQDPSDIPYIKGVDINKYKISFSGNYLRGDWKTFLDKNDTFRFSEDFLKRSQKIVYRQTSNKLVGALDVNQNYNDKTIHIIVNKPEYNFDLRFVLALFNSKLINYFFQSFKEEEGRAFAQVKTVDIKNLPFINASEFEQLSLITLVDQIIQTNGSDTVSLQKEIDYNVYKLYNLTPEEIKIVESSDKQL
jgi:adenine-specific DNA-methyltransferase